LTSHLAELLPGYPDVRILIAFSGGVDSTALLAALAEERAQLEARLADPALYAPGRGAEVTAAQTRLAALEREAAAAEAEWLEAATALEAARG
jgi:ATP-binding cassette subfamily F protein 3